MNTVVPSDVDPCLIKLSSISHFERKTRICTSSCGYILNIIILVMSYYLIVTWSSRDRKINWTKIFLTEINQRVRRKSCDTKMQKCYESCYKTGLRDSIKCRIYKKLLNNHFQQIASTDYRRKMKNILHGLIKWSLVMIHQEEFRLT